MNIRNLENNDLLGCAEIFASVFSSDPWNEKWTTQLAYDRLAHFFNSSGFIGIVAEIDDILGFVLGNTEPFYFGTLFYLKEMCIRTDQQGNGFGRQLLVKMENELKARDVKSIYLGTDHGIPAAKFYKQNGFTYEEKMGFFAKRLV